MQVTPVASTTFFGYTASKASGYKQHEDDYPYNSDELAEFAGRACYESWNRPNPETATNEGYLNHILDVDHQSVLEHGSVTFYVTGVSRNLLLELERHRHLSFSVVSQRYVNMAESKIVIPPLFEDEPGAIEILNEAQRRAVHDYERLIDLAEVKLHAQGVKGTKARKRAREAARAVLPGGTETRYLVTSNIRGWRYVISKRYDESADAEIRELAGLILLELRDIAPNSVQDIPEEPYS